MSKRLQRVNELLREEVSKLLLREIDFGQSLLTVTKVETSVDLKQAKIMISVLPEEKSQRALQILEKNIFHLQQLLNKKLNMRPVPKIYFQIDKSAVNAQRIEELLQKINEEKNRH